MVDVQTIDRRRSYTQIVNRLAERRATLLGDRVVADERLQGRDLREQHAQWLRSLEEDYGVSIQLETMMGPDNRPSAIDGIISSDDALPAGFQWAFRIDRHETRCCLRAVAD